MNKKVVYWAVEILDPYDLLTIEPVKNWINENKLYKLNETLHMTLIYLGGKKADVEYKENDVSDMTIDALCYDGVCACFRIVQSDVKSSNKYPHITLALRNGTPAVYSNELLESGRYTEIPISCVVKGVVVAH